MQKKFLSYAGGIFESGFFLSGSEFYGSQWDSDTGLHNQPEKRLMLAILVDAVECFQKHAPKHQGKPDRLFRASREWIFQDDLKWPFSFLNICDAVGIDPRYLRNGLDQWSDTRFKTATANKVQSGVRELSNSRRQMPANPPIISFR